MWHSSNKKQKKRVNARSGPIREDSKATLNLLCNRQKNYHFTTAHAAGLAPDYVINR